MGGGRSPGPALASGDPACGALLSLAVLAGPGWAPDTALAEPGGHALLLTLLPARPPPRLPLAAGRPGLHLPDAPPASAPGTPCAGRRTPSRGRFERRARRSRTAPSWCAPARGPRGHFPELDASACQAAWALKAELAGTAGLCARSPPPCWCCPRGRWLRPGPVAGAGQAGLPGGPDQPHGRGPPLAHAVLSSGPACWWWTQCENPRTRALAGLGRGRRGLLSRGPSGGWL